MSCNRHISLDIFATRLIKNVINLCGERLKGKDGFTWGIGNVYVRLSLGVAWG